MQKGLVNIIEKLLPNPDEAALALTEYTGFRRKEGIFARDIVWRTATDIPAYSWWSQFGTDHPHLRKVAVKVLAQTTSASGCERNWSCYDFIHNKKRNRLTSQRASDLVYVFSNLRMLRKFAAVDYWEDNVPWLEVEEDESEDEGEQAEQQQEGTQGSAGGEASGPSGSA